MKFEFEVTVTCSATAVVQADSLEEAQDNIRQERFEITAVDTKDAQVSENERLNAADDLAEDLNLVEG